MPQLVAAIASACGIADPTITPLASGAQSDVWKIESRDERFALRIGQPRAGESNAYELDYGIRRRLVDLDAPVAAPVCTNRDVDAGVAAEWSLDSFVEGDSGTPGVLSRQVCRDLGATLAKLHRLPASGYGRMDNDRDRLNGDRLTPGEGLSSRLYRPWPFSGDQLADHPVANKIPELLTKLSDLEPELVAVVDPGGAPSVIHSDLHQGQFMHSRGRLTALLDFGEATAGPPAWDIGSFAYFHGWKRTQSLLEGYAEDEAERSNLEAAGRRFAVLIALHHAGRSVPLKQPERMAGAVRYLRENL